MFFDCIKYVFISLSQKWIHVVMVLLGTILMVTFVASAQDYANPDLDGDNSTDPAVYEMNTGNWFFVGTSTGFGTQLGFGGEGFIPVPGDYDGDGMTDAAVYDLSTGNWFVVGSTAGFFAPALSFGGAGFIPVPGDYDGDGVTDAAVYQDATGNWFVVGSTTGFFAPALSFGGVGFTVVPGDYDGDGVTDPAVYDPATGNWFVVGSTVGFFTPALNFGGAGFSLVPGDYDGDGVTDPAVYDSATGNWFVVGSTAGFFTPALSFGGAGFSPVPGDYDGDGVTDAAVYDSATANWFVVGSTVGFFTPALNFGGAGFSPLGISLDRSQEFIDALVDIVDQQTQGQISADESTTEFVDIINSINNTPGGTDLLKLHLENDILGGTFTVPAETFSRAIPEVVSAGVIQDILNSKAYKMLEAFLESVIFSLPSPAITIPIQASKPEIFVALSQLQVQAHINDHLLELGPVKAGELYNISTTNPYEAERQLLTALGKPIPAWLQPAPTCSDILNCTPPSPGVLEVTPTTGLSMSGNEGGPFTPSSQLYTLKNTGGSSIDFNVSKDQSWISRSPSGGSLAPGASTTVLVAVNSNATALNAGLHSDTVTFTNQTNGNGTTSRPVTLTVNQNNLIWTVDMTASAGGFTDSCKVVVSLPASGGTKNGISCVGVGGIGVATVTVTTVGTSTMQVNGTGFGSTLDASCSGSGGGSGTIFTGTTFFSASGSLGGNMQCSFGNFTLGGSFSATAPN